MPWRASRALPTARSAFAGVLVVASIAAGALCATPARAAPPRAGVLPVVGDAEADHRELLGAALHEAASASGGVELQPRSFVSAVLSSLAAAGFECAVDDTECWVKVGISGELDVLALPVVSSGPTEDSLILEVRWIDVASAREVRRASRPWPRDIDADTARSVAAALWAEVSAAPESAAPESTAPESAAPESTAPDDTKSEAAALDDPKSEAAELDDPELDDAAPESAAPEAPDEAMPPPLEAEAGSEARAPESGLDLWLVGGALTAGAALVVALGGALAGLALEAEAQRVIRARLDDGVALNGSYLRAVEAGEIGMFALAALAVVVAGGGGAASLVGLVE